MNEPIRTMNLAIKAVGRGTFAVKENDENVYLIEVSLV